MSSLTNDNQFSSKVGFNSIFEMLARRIKRTKTLGLSLLISGFALFFITIILVTAIGIYALIVMIPMPFLIFFGFRFFYAVTRSGAESAYKKVNAFLKSRDAFALKSLANLPLKDEFFNHLPENYFQRLFSIAALIDLYDPNSTNLAVQFYRELVDEKIKLDDAKVMLQALASKLEKTSFVELLL
ncbi:MAG: hypothetical protein JXA54_04310 [Candidatus Heimdallarchaeota archaeon]|nr:hypothetical protein [Candidatus Heimdallarchaeota archaeon]